MLAHGTPLGGGRGCIILQQLTAASGVSYEVQFAFAVTAPAVPQPVTAPTWFTTLHSHAQGAHSPRLLQQ